ncbi:MAG: glutamate racemase [Desulfovibrionaceae bacterium]|nr:glutamate racemase [Desulfovibrionaceae bacterium]
MAIGAHLPIALFDSGMGGLTVFKAISKCLPYEDLLYLGDTARLPYGTKGQTTIIRYTLSAARTLLKRGVKMLVVACNTATANALPHLKQEFASLPIIGVVEPGARAALKVSANGRILVIATEATIKSGVYTQAIHALNKDAQIAAQACTLFVPVAEEGLLEGPIVEALIHHYLDAWLDAPDSQRPDTMLLGCTHFPLLKQSLARVVGPSIQVVDPAEMVADTVKAQLTELQLLKPDKTKGLRHFMTTDNKERFARTGSLFLGQPLPTTSIELVDL